MDKILLSGKESSVVQDNCIENSHNEAVEDGDHEWFSNLSKYYESFMKRRHPQMKEDRFSPHLSGP